MSLNFFVDTLYVDKYVEAFEYQNQCCFFLLSVNDSNFNSLYICIIDPGSYM